MRGNFHAYKCLADKFVGGHFTPLGENISRKNGHLWKDIKGYVGVIANTLFKKIGELSDLQEWGKYHI